MQVQSWLSEAAWLACHSLKELAVFSKIIEDFEANGRLWKNWSNLEKPEANAPPPMFEGLSLFQRILLVKAVRPDRVVPAMTAWVADVMGDAFVEQEPFNVQTTFHESGPSAPMFFVLFPGADITKELEPLCKKYDFRVENGRFTNISMGQGQEKLAEEALDRRMVEGGWVFLQNIHLMQRWLPSLERKLELAAEKAHPEFRCFLSAEPPPMPLMRTIPESILQASIKIANEPPQSIKANLKRAWNNFSQNVLERSTKPFEFRTTLFALCFFHSVMLGRRKFGAAGWSRLYSFNTGDLTICADVLHNYLDASATIPWEDLRYIFGEIMYGGHITDVWDRRVCSTYLKVLIRKELLNELEIAPGFKAKTDGSYTEYRQYIDKALPDESPVLFGLHPNADISKQTAEQEKLIDTIRVLQGEQGSRLGGSREDSIRETLSKILEELPGVYNIVDLNNKVAAGDKTPYIVVLLQECERMNVLIMVIRTSLSEVRPWPLFVDGCMRLHAMKCGAEYAIMSVL